MIPAEELAYDRPYRDEERGFVLYRHFCKEAAGSDVVIAHNLKRVPKQVWIVAAEGKDMRCWVKLSQGKLVKDLDKVTVQFNDTNAGVILRIE